MSAKKFTPALNRILKIATIEAEKSKAYVGASHVLIAMLLDDENSARIMLSESGLTADGIRTGKFPASV